MDIFLRFDGASVVDDFGALRAELLEHEVSEVRFVQRQPATGTLGPVLDALQVAVGPGAALSAVTAGVVAWLRYRSGDIDVRMTAADGRSVTVSAKRVRDLRADQLLAEIERIRAVLDADGDPTDPG